MATALTPRLATPRSVRSGGSGNGTVPFLPGYTPRDLGKSDHKKSQTLAYGPGGLYTHDNKSHPASFRNGYDKPKIDLSVLETLRDPYHRYDLSARSMTHDERAEAKESARNTYRPPAEPAWLRHDRQVLRFHAHFQEPVHESPTENYRVRHCVICFYLEDGTMMISEPKIENSGLPQGTFVKRHRIPKPEGGFYGAEDLECGRNIDVYSRIFRITGCDDFTKAFITRAMNKEIGREETPPKDRFRELSESARVNKHLPRGKEIAESKEYMELALGGGRRNRKLDQFLANDRKVLAFKCYWDDTTRYGARLYYNVHYYLSDDTVEVHENLARNSGRDTFPVFWARAKLRKNPYLAATPGMLEPEPVYWLPEDFIVGQHVEVYGRKIYLYDCDDFTRNFYKKYMGVEQASLKIETPAPKHIKLRYPPHTGIGSEEDSLANCIRLQARAPPKDEVRLMADSDKMLRFEARIENSREEDVGRRFVVTVFLADDSISIWELKGRNSGHSEGRFASRSRKKNPVLGRWFLPQDFYVGAVVEVTATAFRLVGAEEATLKMMENQRSKFPVADPAVVLPKLAPLEDQLRGTSRLNSEELSNLAAAAGVHLLDQELITISRALGRDVDQDGSFAGAVLADRIASGC